MSILITLALFTVGLAFAVAADGEAVTPGDYTVYADTACTEAVAAYDDFVTALENATAGQCVVATTAPETLREPEKNIADGIYVKFGTGVEIDTQNTPYVFTEVADADYLSVDVLEYEVTVDGAAKIYVDADDETNGNLQTIVNMGTSVTISLMQDANAYSLNGKNNLCAIESSQTINIDVNGYTINLDKLSYTSGKFTVSGKFYVYSSRVGGVIDCADGNTFARANGTFGDGVIQFGNEGDKLEDGLLTVFADQVLTGQDTATVSSTSGAFSAYGVSFVNNDIGNAVMFSTYTRMTFTFEIAASSLTEREPQEFSELQTADLKLTTLLHYSLPVRSTQRSLTARSQQQRPALPQAYSTRYVTVPETPTSVISYLITVILSVA